MDRPFQALEQVLVVDDVAVFLVVAVQAVDAADGLEQPVILHLFIDVEIGRRRRVEAGQQFVHDDQELHLPRFVDEFLFDLFFELFESVDRLVLDLPA